MRSATGLTACDPRSVTTVWHALGQRRETYSVERLFRWGAMTSVLLLALAATIAHLPGVEVHAGPAAPLFAEWRPRLGVGTPPVLLLFAWCATDRLWHASHTETWGRLLVGAWLLGLAWMVSLALVDGLAGIGSVLTHHTEYLVSARSVDDVGELLRTFVARIPLNAKGHWPVHVAGHPPGALLVFVGLDRLGLGSGLASGLVVCALAATTPVSVAVAGRALGFAPQIRTVLPFLVIGPFALWQAVSADAVFAATAGWTVALAALAARATRPGRAGCLAIGSGMLLGVCALLSYGLPLVGFLVVAAMAAGAGWSLRMARLIVAAALAGAAVLALLAVLGYSYWEAYPALHQRYWDGLAAARPNSYWLWGNLAVLTVSAGPVMWGCLTAALPRLRVALYRPTEHPLLVLVTGATVAMAVADLSLMSKAEVERIWLPFLPWLLLSTALLPTRWRRRALVGQAFIAVLTQHLLATPW